MQQSSATPSLHLDFLGVAEDCCMLSILLAVPSCTYSFWHGVIPTSYFIFNDFYTCNIIGNGLRKIVACSHSSSQCLLVSTVFGTVSSLHPTSFFNDFYTCYIRIQRWRMRASIH